MTDTSAPAAEAAPAAAPAAPAPADNASDSVQPLGDRPIQSESPPAPVKEKAPEVKKPSISETLKSAEKKVEASEKAKRDEERVAKGEKPVDPKAVDPKAKIEPKPAEAKAAELAKPKFEAPARWKPEVKAKWDAVDANGKSLIDDDVKAEVDRTVKELTKGYEQHKEKATKWDDLKEFEDMAATYKTDIKTALKNYTAIEKGLASTDQAIKLSAIEEVFRVAKISPQDYAAFITKQPPEQVKSQSDAAIRHLQEEVRQLKQQSTQTTQTVQEQQRAAAESDLNTWAQGKPVVTELAPQIAVHVKSGLSLDDAYSKAFEEAKAFAQKLGFAPTAQTPAAETPVAPAAPAALGQRSIRGAPSAGASAVKEAPSKSVGEAVRKAFEALGT